MEVASILFTIWLWIADDFMCSGPILCAEHIHVGCSMLGRTLSNRTSISFEHRLENLASDWCINDVYPIVLSIWHIVLLIIIFCRWADRRTRALFIDFVFFNAYTNLFTIVKYVYEVSACGSLVEFHDIDSIRLYTYVGEHGLVLLIMQLLWLLTFTISTVREIICIVQNRNLYFKESWNWLKLANIVVVCGTMVAFALKSVYIQLTVEEVKNNIGKYRNCDQEGEKQDSFMTNIETCARWDHIQYR